MAHELLWLALAMMKLALALLLFVGASAHADSTPATSADVAKVAASALTEEQILALMLKDLSPRVRDLGREVTLYHYQHTGAADPALNVDDNPALVDRAKARIDDFWQPTQDAGYSFYGEGFYAAGDPVASRSYGGDDFKLIMLHVHPNLKILDDTNYGYMPSAQTALDARGCDENLSGLLSQDDSQFCRDLGLKALARLKIDAIQYIWMGTRPPQCDTKAAKSAFVIIRSDVIKPQDVQFFFPTIPAKDPHASDRIEIETYARQFGSHLWPSLTVPAENDVAWLKKNILNCDNLR